MTQAIRFQLPSILLIFLLLSCWSCGGSSAGGDPTDAPAAQDSARTTPDNMEGAAARQADHNCVIEAPLLEGNQIWLRDRSTLLTLVADSTTYDPELGESHRVLLVHEPRTCELIDRQVLPVNVSPDFPYYLAEITYNSVNRLIAIRGFDIIFIYEVAARRLIPDLTPQFRNERFGVDAQSGMIMRLELWENYLTGFSQDYGAVVFDLSDPQSPQPVLAAAEYKIAPDNYHQLFLLPTNDGVFQALMPSYDIDAGDYRINPVFPDPVVLNPAIPDNVADNRFLVIRLRDEARTPVAIDMLNRRRVDLPAEVARQSTQNILQWARQNTGR